MLDGFEELKPAFSNLEIGLLANCNINTTAVKIDLTGDIVQSLPKFQNISGYEVHFKGGKNQRKNQQGSGVKDTDNTDDIGDKDYDTPTTTTRNDQDKFSKKRLNRGKSMEFLDGQKKFKIIMSGDFRRKHEKIMKFMDDDAVLNLSTKQKRMLKGITKSLGLLIKENDSLRQRILEFDFQGVSDLKSQLEFIIKMYESCKSSGKIDEFDHDQLNREAKVLRKKNRLLHEKVNQIA